VVDFVHLATSSAHLDLAMEQVRLGAASPLAGQSLVGANLRQRFGVVVVASSAPTAGWTSTQPPTPA